MSLQKITQWISQNNLFQLYPIILTYAACAVFLNVLEISSIYSPVSYSGIISVPPAITGLQCLFSIPGVYPPNTCL